MSKFSRPERVLEIVRRRLGGEPVSLIAEDMGFSGVVPVSGQTYSRKVDAGFLATLSGISINPKFSQAQKA